MPYRFFANALVLFHACFVLFVMTGACLLLWRRWIALLHLPAAVWGVIVEACNLKCPLTHYENILRAAGGSVEYQGGFIDHYIMPVLYPDPITRDFKVTLAILIVTINIILYTLAFTRPGRRAHRRRASAA
jgi:hypothetical protein